MARKTLDKGLGFSQQASINGGDLTGLAMFGLMRSFAGDGGQEIGFSLHNWGKYMIIFVVMHLFPLSVHRSAEQMLGGFCV